MGFAQASGMHVPIERLYEFVVEEMNLTEAEQSHLIRCDFCIEWLDACVTEKVSLIRTDRG
jgi:hypothetical protein